DLALRATRAQGRVVLSGMPARADLTPAWFRELEVVGAYSGAGAFTDAMELARSAELGALVGATYPLDRWREAIDHASSAGKPGMKLTIAFDDISLPLPQMKTPDIRGRVMEHVLEAAARAGVDDVKIIAALSLHRRMTPAELKRAVGERVYRSFYPESLYNHDAEDKSEVTYIGETDQGEEVEINKRAAESDLIVYVNINLVA